MFPQVKGVFGATLSSCMKVPKVSHPSGLLRPVGSSGPRACRTRPDIGARVGARVDWGSADIAAGKRGWSDLWLRWHTRAWTVGAPAVVVDWFVAGVLMWFGAGFDDNG
ncbi:hypothetical protein GCM10010279_69200 [Streptomyces mutabilis]|nr:hypothetical protein GCM10010279_69200 [Streptomyces mutabilis]